MFGISSCFKGNGFELLSLRVYDFSLHACETEIFLDAASAGRITEEIFHLWTLRWGRERKFY